MGALPAFAYVLHMFCGTAILKPKAQMRKRRAATKITREQGEAFVRYGENAYNSFAALKSMVLVFCFLDFIGWMIWAASGRGLGYAVAMTAVTVAYEAGILVLASPRTEKTYRLRFLTNFLCIYAIALEFLLVGLLMCLAADAGSPVWQSLELLVIFLGCPVLCCLYTRHRIGKGVYLGKGSPQKGNVYPWAMGASLLGGLVARLLMPTLDQSQALRLLLWCIEGIFFCISLGAPISCGSTMPVYSAWIATARESVSPSCCARAPSPSARWSGWENACCGRRVWHWALPSYMR